jgi:hypothetical protein
MSGIMAATLFVVFLGNCGPSLALLEKDVANMGKISYEVE